MNKKEVLSEKEIMERLKEIAKLDMPLEINKKLRKLKNLCNYPLQILQKQLNYVRKDMNKGAVTNDTVVTDVTNDTVVTNDEIKACVSFVTINTPLNLTIFGSSTLEQIIKHLVLSKKALTFGELAMKTGKSEVNIRNTISRNKSIFGTIKPDGKICYTYLLQMFFFELQQRIDKIKAEDAVEKARIEKEKEFKQEYESLKSDLLIEAKNFFEFNKKDIGNHLKRGKNIIYVDFMQLSEFSNILSEEVLLNPEKTLRLMELAIEELGLVDKCRVRIKNLLNSSKVLVEDIRSTHLDQFISIKGKILQRSEARPQVVNAKFECPSCGTIISVLQMEKKFREPLRCSCGRRGGFKLIDKEMVDTARFVIQDLQEIAKNSSPSRLNCFVKEDLASSIVLNNIIQAGNDIIINGILKEVPVPLSSGGLSTRFELAIEVNYVELAEESIELENLTEEEFKKFDDLSKRIDEKGINELIPSYSPVVKGYNYVKQALILYSCNKLNNPGIDEERNKSNILLIGDPSTAKSVLVRFLTEISIGAKKVVGGSSSAVGITGSVTKDEFLGGWMINPGALVLAKDVLFLEELNTMEDEEKSKIQDAMESQYVDITKANVSGRYKVKTGIVSCANPLAGHFIPSWDKKEIVKQFKIPTPILSRFDTIFIFRDTQKEELDFEISMNMKKRRNKLLKVEFDKIFLKKFFYYIKSKEEPEMSVEFEILSARVYSILRKLSGKDNNVNARLSEAIDRMTIASAKLRGSKLVEEKDLERVIDILSHSYLTTPDYSIIKENLDIGKEIKQELEVPIEKMTKK